MTWWKKIIQGDDDQPVDYYHEGCQLLKAGKYHEAVTSFRLALRETPNDTAVLMQIAIAHTRIGMTEEAAKNYRSILQKDEGAVAAHYGLAFLLLQDGKSQESVEHLRAFLASPPEGPEAEAHIRHARQKLSEITGEPLVEDAT